MGDPPTAQLHRNLARNKNTPASRILMPVRMHAWMNGDMGRMLERTLAQCLGDLRSLRITRLPKAFLIEADEAPGPFLETCYRAANQLEDLIRASFPVLHHEMGPVWTGMMQSVFEDIDPQQPL